MKDDVLLALILGAGLSALSIVGNFVIADPHTLRVFPFALLLLLVPAVVFWAARRREAGGASSDQVRVFGVRVGVIAGATFAVATGLLSGYWFGWSDHEIRVPFRAHLVMGIR
jgi:hypothetical protein